MNASRRKRPSLFWTRSDALPSKLHRTVAKTLSRMNPEERSRIAGREKVGLGIVEKDYAITVALLAISRTEFSKMMIFKGGTAIKKIF